MRVPLSRRTRLAFLAVPFLIALLAGGALAKTPYTITKVVEGDPGDGVLNPQSYDSPAFLGPETYEDGGTTSTPAAATTAVGTTPPRVMSLPTSLYVPGLGWAVLTPLWLLHVGRWTHAP